MCSKRFLAVLLALCVLVPALEATAQVSKQRYEIMRLIRREKMQLILPGAMRDNNVDMWIQVARAGDPDPMEYEFGAYNGYLIFQGGVPEIEEFLRKIHK